MGSHPPCGLMVTLAPGPNAGKRKMANFAGTGSAGLVRRFALLAPVRRGWAERAGEGTGTLGFTHGADVPARPIADAVGRPR